MSVRVHETRQQRDRQNIRAFIRRTRNNFRNDAVANGDANVLLRSLSRIDQPREMQDDVVVISFVPVAVLEGHVFY